jgi:hypothetical protein
MYDPGKALLLLALDGLLKEAEIPIPGGGQPWGGGPWVEQRERELTAGGRKLYPNFLANKPVSLTPADLADLETFLGKQAPERMRGALAKNFANAAASGRGDLVPGAYRQTFHSWLGGRDQTRALTPEQQVQETTGQKSVAESHLEAAHGPESPFRRAARSLYGIGESRFREGYDQVKGWAGREFADTQRLANTEREESNARSLEEGARRATAVGSTWLEQQKKELAAELAKLRDAASAWTAQQRDVTVERAKAEAPAIGAAAGGAASQGARDELSAWLKKLFGQAQAGVEGAWNNPGQAAGQVWDAAKAHPLISLLALALGVGGTAMLGRSLFGGGRGGGGGYDQGYADAARDRRRESFRKGAYD